DRYRRVYAYRESSGDSLADFLAKTVAERVGDERADLIVLQHGPQPTVFLDLSPSQVNESIPAGYLRRVFSSGCKMWGDLFCDGDFKISGQLRLLTGDHLESLGVDEYILFSGNQSSLR